MKVSKFGGSSVADANQWRRVSAIVGNDPERRVIVVSAPGKRTAGDTKVTDLLYDCHACARRNDSFEHVFSTVADRFRSIVHDLGVSFDLETELRKVHAAYAGRGLHLVGVSVDAQGSNDAIRAFMNDFAMNYEIWLDPDERVLSTFLVVGVPATFLVDRDGVLRWRKIGPVEPGDTSLTTAIQRALKGQGA